MKVRRRSVQYLLRYSVGYSDFYSLVEKKVHFVTIVA